MDITDTPDRPVPESSTLHLVDLESLCGEPDPSLKRVRRVLAEYLGVAEWDEDDHVVVAASTGVMADVALELECGWRLLAGRGPDGSDRALLHHTHPKLVARRYDRLVIGSGREHYAELAEAVRTYGGDVWVVAREDDLSSHLADAAGHVALLTGGATHPAERSA